MHVAEKMMFLTFVLVLLKIKGSVAGTSDGELGACIVEGVSGVCRLSCESGSTKFCVPNVADCTAANPNAYCSISKPVNCSTANGDRRCSDICSCDPQTSVSRTDLCTSLDKNAVCCGPKTGTCTVEGVTGVCRLSCESSSTSFCVPNVADCTAANPNAYCSISKPVSCSTANGDGHCSDICSCDPQTSNVSRTDLCTSLDKNAVCCGPKSDDDEERPFTRANISAVSNCLATHIFYGVKSASCCQNRCSLEESCKAFVLFKDRETGTKLCQLMKEATLCSAPTLLPQLDLIDYFEKPELKIRNILQHNDYSKPRPANEAWRRDCWSPECPISAAIGFRDDSNLQSDVDFIKCGLYSSDMVLLTADAERMDVTSDQASRCKPNYLLTAIHDNAIYWSDPDHYKCLKLANWRTVDEKCTTETSLSLKEYTCPWSEGIPTYVVGIARSSRGIQAITCCPVEKI